MFFYVAGRIKESGSVQWLVGELENRGHEVTLDWTSRPSYKPYEKTNEDARRTAEQMITACQDCDFFVLLWDDNLYGALVEFGVALGNSLGKPDKKIYILGPKTRKSIFETLSQVEFYETTARFLDVIECDDGCRYCGGELCMQCPPGIHCDHDGADRHYTAT